MPRESVGMSCDCCDIILKEAMFATALCQFLSIEYDRHHDDPLVQLEIGLCTCKLHEMIAKRQFANFDSYVDFHNKISEFQISSFRDAMNDMERMNKDKLMVANECQYNCNGRLCSGINDD